MEYGKDYRATVVPVDMLEGEEGLIKVTDFDQIIPITLRALLKGYKCTDQMLDRVEAELGIEKINFSPIQFFITYNPHCFAACITQINKSLYLSSERDILVQNEILQLVESFPGSLKRPGNYQKLRRLDLKKKQIIVKQLFYEPPIFDLALRYLSLSKYRQVVESVSEEKYLMVLYIPSN
ncbi:hypothetical protein [Cellulosilyticum sp. I15G10I2]|uniref:hypothetical protein n=1 Tax=Cellulosilyticum sp. I15G10I2 TaxID=1892843 RepID=UPI00085BBDE6|nr:hypothetical protein [Cellulosilyticum sp. I15G10I2]